MSQNPTVKHDYCSPEESWILSVTNRCYVILDCTSCCSVLRQNRTELQTWRSPVTNISTLFTETKKKHQGEKNRKHRKHLQYEHNQLMVFSFFGHMFFTTSCVRCWYNKSIKAIFYLFYDWNSKNTQVEKQPPTSRDPLLPQDERLKKKTSVHHHLSETSKPPHLSPSGSLRSQVSPVKMSWLVEVVQGAGPSLLVIIQVV